MQVETFLADHPPFDALQPDQLARIVASVEIQFFPEGTSILQQGGEPAPSLYVIRTGAVELLDEGRMLDLLGPGEAFGHVSMLSGPAVGVRAHEDTLCYVIDGAVAKDVLGRPAGLAHPSTSLQARGRDPAAPRDVASLRAVPVPVKTLLTRDPVSVAADATIREAAELMTRERVSSVLLRRGDEIGIVTDRDLRSRVLAADVAPDTPVDRIASFPVVTADVGTMSDEVLLLMLEHGFHHVAVTDDAGRIAGVVSDTDLLGRERTTPFSMLRGIERASSDGAVVTEVSRISEIVIALVEADEDPVVIGRVIATTIDAATRRLLVLAIRGTGDPPGPWAWVSLGSEARQEQSLSTDQDHALVYDPLETPVDDADRYFAGIAERVTDGLEAAGIPRCREGVMAVDPSWRGSVIEWTEAYATHLREPGMMGTIFTSIALDHRRVAGQLEVGSSIDATIRDASRDMRFVRRLVRTALDHRPPTGFFRDLVVDSTGARAGTLNVKDGGITPITDLARAHAVRSGVSGIPTLGRLENAVAGGILDPQVGSGLREAFRLLWHVRLEHQARQVRAGLEPDDHVDPTTLGPLTRRGLKDAFRIIASAQRALGLEMGFRLP